MTTYEGATPGDYRDLFEIDRRGQRVYDDLLARFALRPKKTTGIDRLIDQSEFIGQCRVVGFIKLMCDTANGIHEPELPEFTQTQEEGNDGIDD